MVSLVCELGYPGWVRTATHEKHTDADELLCCNFDKLLEDGILALDNSCNLVDAMGGSSDEGTSSGSDAEFREKMNNIKI